MNLWNILEYSKEEGPIATIIPDYHVKAWPIDYAPKSVKGDVLNELQPFKWVVGGYAAVATTDVRFEVMLNSESRIIPGAGAKIHFQSYNPVNHDMSSHSIIAPSAYLQEGDAFMVSVSEENYTFTYGGFSHSKDIRLDDGFFGAIKSSEAFSPYAGIRPCDHFTIATSDGYSATYTFTPQGSSQSLGQFHTLDTLATAINETPSKHGNISAEPALYARVVDGELYVAPVNGNAGMSFVDNRGNIASTLGLYDTSVADPGVSRFTTLDNLHGEVLDTGSGLLGTVMIPTYSAASLEIYAINPLDTITFSALKDSSILSELGIQPNTYTPAYDATNMIAPNMASDLVNPSYSSAFQIYDTLGKLHTLIVDFGKIGNNFWAVEISASNPKEVVLQGNHAHTGLIAHGTALFNGDGTLNHVSDSIKQPLHIQWSDGALDSDVTLYWGREGAALCTPGNMPKGGTDGLSQFATSSESNIIANGMPVGKQIGVALDEHGYTVLHHSYGGTRTIYKLSPMHIDNIEALEAEILNPDPDTYYYLGDWA